MAKPKKVLYTKSDGFVLEMFFNDYIVPWYQERAVNAVTYEKAKKEIDILKKRSKKKKTSSDSVEDDKASVKSLPDDVNSKAKPKSEPIRGASTNPANLQKGNSNSRQTGTRNPQSTKAEIDTQSVLLENAKLKTKLSKMKEDMEEMYTVIAESDIQLKEKDQQLLKLRKALENSKAQVDELTTRLSKLAGDKLRSGNPDLADLSDPYRPTELGKLFSEIYDNEWSDAFENVLQNEEEERRVGLLHGVVKKAFSFCEKVFDDQVTYVQTILLAQDQVDEQEHDAQSSPKSPAPKNETKTTGTANIHNLLKDFRKQLAPQTAENVAKEFVGANLETFIIVFGLKRGNIHKTLKKYAFRCAQLSWFMMVCDPPMALSEDKPEITFDINLYKPYTKSIRDLKNPVVKLPVWPALHLNVGGPLVAKGVAQPGEGIPKK